MTEVALIVGGGPGIERELREAVHGARHASRRRREESSARSSTQHCANRGDHGAHARRKSVSRG